MTPIRKGVLSEHFRGVVAKTLTLVETVSQRSNQHEFQGTRPFRNLFGDADIRGIPTRFIAFENEGEGQTQNGFVSWSNVRKGRPRAPEYHLYYTGNAVTESMQPGDTMFLALRQNGEALVIIASPKSTVRRQLTWLFGLSEPDSSAPEYRGIDGLDDKVIGFAARYILEELGIETEEPDSSRLDSLIEHFGLTMWTALWLFPSVFKTGGNRAPGNHWKIIWNTYLELIG